jgi:hypothetical protein
MRVSCLFKAATCFALASAAAIKDESTSVQGLAKRWLPGEKGETRHFPEPKYFSKSTDIFYASFFEIRDARLYPLYALTFPRIQPTNCGLLADRNWANDISQRSLGMSHDEVAHFSRN